MTIGAILFDYNGLLVNTVHARFKTNKGILKKYFNIDITWKEYERSWMEKRKGLSDFLKDKKLPLNRLDSIKQERARMFRTYEEDVHPMPNAIVFLKRISENPRKFKLGVVSNNYREEVDVGLERFDIRYFFKTIITANDVNLLKPNPAPYLLASQRLRVRPENCLCLENSSIGVEAAKAAGMYCIAIPYSYTREEGFRLADRTVNNLKQVTLKLISEIEGKALEKSA